jgi:hypothetical protein
MINKVTGRRSWIQIPSSPFFTHQVNYSINSCLFSVIVGQNNLAMPMPYRRVQRRTSLPRLVHKTCPVTTIVVCCTVVAVDPSSSSSSSSITTITTGRTRRYCSNLLHQSHHVCSCPLFCDFAINDS